MLSRSLPSLALVLAAACLLPPAGALPSQPISAPVALIPQPLSLAQKTGQPGFLLSQGIRINSATAGELERAAVQALKAAGFHLRSTTAAPELLVIPYFDSLRLNFRQEDGSPRQPGNALLRQQLLMRQLKIDVLSLLVVTDKLIFESTMYKGQSTI